MKVIEGGFDQKNKTDELTVSMFVETRMKSSDLTTQKASS